MVTMLKRIGWALLVGQAVLFFTGILGCATWWTLDTLRKAALYDAGLCQEVKR